MISSVLVLCVTLQGVISTFKPASKCYAVSPQCGVLNVGGNLDVFSYYWKESYNEFERDAKVYEKNISKVRNEYEDLYGYMLDFVEEQSEFAQEIKEKNINVEKEIEKTFGSGSSGVSERYEYNERQSHEKTKGSSYNKEVSISGEGVGGKLMALTSGLVKNPFSLGQRLGENPSKKARALLLFNPGCRNTCGWHLQGLFSTWTLIIAQCWQYYRSVLASLSCGRRNALMRKYLRNLCRPYSAKLRRMILRYFRRLYGRSVCGWR